MSNGPQFFQTGYGRTYYEYQLPTITEHLGNIAKELKRANDLKEFELHGRPNSQEVDKRRE
jgi:hypothetical protein